jgi:hypothetical protein
VSAVKKCYGTIITLVIRGFFRLKPVILATWEAEIGKIKVQG